MATYSMHVAGLTRELPICKVNDELSIGAFIMFGDAELTVACARDLLKLAEQLDYDYLFTAEAKSIPLIHEMARQSGAKKYFIARKGPKVYMPDPISVDDQSITTLSLQKLYLGSDEAAMMTGKKILIVDDVISTGGSLKAMSALVEKAGGTVAGCMAVLAEGGAAERIGIPPEECWVFEDSPIGVEAGWRAHCRVVMVPDQVAPTDEVRAMCWGVFPDLEEAWEAIQTTT